MWTLWMLVTIGTLTQTLPLATFSTQGACEEMRTYVVAEMTKTWPDTNPRHYWCAPQNSV